MFLFTHKAFYSILERNRGSIIIFVSGKYIHWCLLMFLCSFQSAVHNQLSTDPCHMKGLWDIINLSKPSLRELYHLCYQCLYSQHLWYFQGILIRIPFSVCFHMTAIVSLFLPHVIPGCQQCAFSFLSQSSPVQVSIKLNKRATACLN